MTSRWGADRPLVSCLMVTQAKRWADGPPPGALAFLAQTYDVRELVIVADEVTLPMREFAEAWPEEVVLCAASVPGLALGALRQESVDACFGEFVANWDDDDVSAPTRLDAQIQALRATVKADACLLARWRVEDLRRGRRFVSPYFGWEGSMVARREGLPSYDPTLRTGEDEALVARFRCVLLLDRPELYIYRVHGENTVGSDGRADRWWEHRTGEAWS